MPSARPSAASKTPATEPDRVAPVSRAGDAVAWSCARRPAELLSCTHRTPAGRFFSPAS
jgi:hypothetical protein